MHVFCTCHERYSKLEQELEDLRHDFRVLQLETLNLNEKTLTLFRRAKKRQEDLERVEEGSVGSERDRVQAAILARRGGNGGLLRER